VRLKHTTNQSIRPVATGLFMRQVADAQIDAVSTRLMTRMPGENRKMLGQLTDGKRLLVPVAFEMGGGTLETT
jgi:hypothetical protein